MLPSQRAALRLLRSVARREIHTGSRVLAQAAEKTESKEKTSSVDPSNPEVAPTLIPWKNYKNEYYEKRGIKVADKSWVHWGDDVPEPYKYLGVRVDPAHVENHGAVWKFFSDWKTGVPASLLLSMPLWMFNYLPPIDERMELGLITVSAGWLAVKAAGPMFRQWKRARVANKVKAMLAHEKELNDEIAASLDAFKSGAGVVEFIKLINGAERSLRKLEADAATRRNIIAQREALIEQLNYLVQISASGAADADVATVRSARANVESQLEKDASLQQKTIEAAIKSLKDGSVAEDVVGPLYSKAYEKARSELVNKPTANPLKSAQQIDIFRKRSGYTEDAVSEATLKRAQSDSSVLAVLTGKVGGKAPAVGAKYVIKAPILYSK